MGRVPGSFSTHSKATLSLKVCPFRSIFVHGPKRFRFDFQVLLVCDSMVGFMFDMLEPFAWGQGWSSTLIRDLRQPSSHCKHHERTMTLTARSFDLKA